MIPIGRGQRANYWWPSNWKNSSDWYNLKGNDVVCVYVAIGQKRLQLRS
jgi:F0F1-type ATP synthase alpha subunit